MPLYRHQDKLLFFAHVPKCAGTSVTEYLKERFGEPAFEDRAYFRVPAPFPWTHTSPQHITDDARLRILPDSFVDFSFAVVRHPVDRIASVYRFQKHSQRKIGFYTSFARWLRGLPQSLSQNPYRYDAHALPQVQFIPKTAEVFRLEDGLDAMIKRLDDVFGPTNGPIAIGHSKKSARKTNVTQRDRALIGQIFADDFRAFGYDEDE